MMIWKRIKKPDEKAEKKLKEEIESEGGLEKKRFFRNDSCGVRHRISRLFACSRRSRRTRIVGFRGLSLKKNQKITE